MELQSKTNSFSIFIFISLWRDKDHNEIVSDICASFPPVFVSYLCVL